MKLNTDIVCNLMMSMKEDGPDPKTIKRDYSREIIIFDGEWGESVLT